jgi:uncharacterized membrane protein YedE/YeeE
MQNDKCAACRNLGRAGRTEMQTLSTPDMLAALGGGALIGLASSLLMAANGRIAGISGIVDGALAPMRAGFGWRLSFVAGLMLAPLLLQLALGGAPAGAHPHALGLVAAGGLLVGFGTRLGSGCTSGHGVCGIARLSKRSLAATATFMAAGMIAVALARMIGAN